MAVKLRLKRMGSKKRAFYRIVASDARSPRDGRFIEIVGTYNPITSPAEINIDEEKALHWLSKGAIPTDTVKNILTKAGVNKKFAESKTKKAPAKKVAAEKTEKVVEKKAPAKKAPAKKETVKKETVKKTTTTKKTPAKKTTKTTKESK